MRFARFSPTLWDHHDRRQRTGPVTPNAITDQATGTPDKTVTPGAITDMAGGGGGPVAPNAITDQATGTPDQTVTPGAITDGELIEGVGDTERDAL